MSFRQSLLRFFVAMLARTWRIGLAGEEHLESARKRGRGIVFALWHWQMVPLIWWHRNEGMTMVVSAHRDGQYLSAAASKWGYLIIEGSSNRGGVGALKGAIDTLNGGGEVAITPDGPRGPTEVAKGGAVEAARRSGALIVPVASRARREIRLRSWDRFSIPLPFTRITVAYDEPFSVDGAREGSNHHDVARLQSGIDAASEAARARSGASRW